MEIVFTEHFKERYFQRIEEKELREKIKNAFLVPPKLARKLNLVKTPPRIIKQKKYLYGYLPGEGHFFCFQIKDQKIIVKTVFLVEGVVREVMEELLENQKKIREII